MQIMDEKVVDTNVILKAGFTADGSRYELRDPNLIRSADSDVWNDRMQFQIDHRGMVKRSGFLGPDLTQYSQPMRCFYLRDNASGEIWTVPQGVIRTPADTFCYSAGKADIAWEVTMHGIACKLRVVVPVDDVVELWTVEIINDSDQERSLSLFSYLPVGRLSPFHQNAHFDPATNGILYDTFPYYVDYADYYSLKDGWNAVFAYTDVKPEACMVNVSDFVGNGTMADPEALKSEVIPQLDQRADAEVDSASIFQHDVNLDASGGKTSVNYAFGPAHNPDEASAIAEKYMKPGAVEAAYEAAQAHQDSFQSAIQVETPDAEFDAFVNHWLPRRSLICVRGMRFMSAPQGRNLLQDSMAGALIDPVSSRARLCQFYGFQHLDGWIPHGMPIYEGASQIRINTIPHKDINSWGPGAVSYYLNETGDDSILDEVIPFADAPEESASLYAHICRGLSWLLNDRTERGLCRIGQGDWNDPLNMAGHGEKGESVWLSEALILALDTWAPIAEARGDIELAQTYLEEADQLRDCINAYAWDGDWYVRGFSDNGKAFGASADTEGKIFLNAQSWAIMAGVTDDARRQSCIDAVESHLQTPSGPMTLSPAYTQMHEGVGKLTLKSPGHLENGSVYCHASTFYAYALYQAGEGERAYSVLRDLLTGSENNPITRSGQLPLYIPNAYLGLPCGRNAGKSTHSPNTGTAAWYLRTVVDCLMGVRSEVNGIRVDPQLPKDWPSVKVIRRWRGATFTIDMVRDASVSAIEVTLDGSPLADRLIPVPEEGSEHQVHVRLPA